MKAILKSLCPNENYQIVEIIKNPISDQNGLALIEIDGERFMTGGLLCEVSDDIIKVLDTKTPMEQWNWLLSIKHPRLFTSTF